MLTLIIRRIVATLVTLLLISVVAFILIQLPPGDFVDSYAGKKTQGGIIITQEELDAMRSRLGLNQPFFHQYLRWIGGVIRGDLGFSWEYHRPVADVIAERLPLTLALAFCTLVFTYLVAVPLGIYSAIRQYSVGDHTATVAHVVRHERWRALFAGVRRRRLVPGQIWGHAHASLGTRDCPWHSRHRLPDAHHARHPLG